jgi:site-specific DNA-methyltransferase (adenine-specific)
MNSKVFNMDCMEYIAGLPDDYFDLAVVDPPYGLDVIKKTYSNKKLKPGKSKASKSVYEQKDWDKKPPPLEYFIELFRVSKYQIVWGANHFISRLPYDSSCWIVWDKINGNSGFADCELAWTSFDSAVRQFKFRWAGMLQGNMKNKEKRIHSTQKPVALYKWILTNWDGKSLIPTLAPGLPG